MLRIFIIAITLLLSSCVDQPQMKKPQQWQLISDYSSISIIHTKNNKISEVSHFKKFNGSINTSGYFDLKIDLTSIESQIPIRNERMAKHLFQTDLYPTADIHTQLKPEDLKSGVHDISFDVDLNGVSSILQAQVMVFEQNGNKVVTLHKPLIVKAKTFALEKGIAKLKNLAHLQSINLTAPVNFVLTFQAK